MTDEFDEPEDLNVRTVTVWCKDPETWELDIDIPEWMSPYEAYGMLKGALRKLKGQLDDLNKDEEEEDDDED